jgi:hypothetical protein
MKRAASCHRMLPVPSTSHPHVYLDPSLRMGEEGRGCAATQNHRAACSRFGTGVVGPIGTWPGTESERIETMFEQGASLITVLLDMKKNTCASELSEGAAGERGERWVEIGMAPTAMKMMPSSFRTGTNKVASKDPFFDADRVPELLDSPVHAYEPPGDDEHPIWRRVLGAKQAHPEDVCGTTTSYRNRKVSWAMLTLWAYTADPLVPR